MKDFKKAKALERLFTELGKQELEYNTVPNYGSIQYTVQLFQMDLPYILDVLAKAIAEERA